MKIFTPHRNNYSNNISVFLQRRFFGIKTIDKTGGIRGILGK